jgi:hypothetical protein
VEELDMRIYSNIVAHAWLAKELSNTR